MASPRATVTLAPRPDATWLALYEREVPVDVLTAVVDGDVVFATRDDAAVGRAAITAAPDGTRWAGMSAVRVAEEHAATTATPARCALRCWPGRPNAAPPACYVQVLADNAPRSRCTNDGLHNAAPRRYIDGRT